MLSQTSTPSATSSEPPKKNLKNPIVFLPIAPDLRPRLTGKIKQKKKQTLSGNSHIGNAQLGLFSLQHLEIE